MSSTSSRRLRWALPAAAAATVGVAVAVPQLASAGAPDLPARTASQLLTDLAQAEPVPLSGTVVQTSRLGLPEVPGAAMETSPLSMLTGSHTLRVWYDGPQRARLALLGQLAEYNTVRSGRDAWTYSSEQDQAVHYTLPAQTDSGSSDRSTLDTRTPGAPTTPQEAADAVLEAIDPTTEVRVDRGVKVAGRDAYVLVVQPRDERSLVGSIRLAVDADTSVPLQVQVFSTRDTAAPAVDIGFTDVSFSRPDASVFTFTPPPGAEVRDVQVPSHDDTMDGAERGAMMKDHGALRQGQPGAPGGATPGQAPAGTAPVVTGEGWTSVVEMTGVDTAAFTGEAAGMLDTLTTRVPEGRLLSSSLMTVLLTDDGRALAGAVPAEVLREAARS